MVLSLQARTLAAVALTGLIFLTGCGGDSSSTPTVTIDGVDIDYSKDVYEAEAGTARIEFRNRGSLAHNLVFRDADGAPVAAGENEFVTAGAEQTFDVELVVGEFAFYCSVPGHEAAGMVGTLVVQ